MIKIEDYSEIKVLAGGDTKPFRYQVADVRFHITVGFVRDYKIGCGNILKLFIGKNLYNSNQSIHINRDRQDKINKNEPYLGEFLRTGTISSNNVDSLLEHVVEYDAEDYGCGVITNMFLRIPNPNANKNINVGFNTNGKITTIFSTPLNKQPTQSNNSSFEYNYANKNILRWANYYKAEGSVSDEFMSKMIQLFGKNNIINIRDSQLHEPYKTKFDEKYREMVNLNKLNSLVFENNN